MPRTGSATKVDGRSGLERRPSWARPSFDLEDRRLIEASPRAGRGDTQHGEIGVDHAGTPNSEVGRPPIPAVALLASTFVGPKLAEQPAEVQPERIYRLGQMPAANLLGRAGDHRIKTVFLDLRGQPRAGLASRRICHHT